MFGCCDWCKTPNSLTPFNGDWVCDGCRWSDVALEIEAEQDGCDEDCYDEDVSNAGE